MFVLLVTRSLIPCHIFMFMCNCTTASWYDVFLICCSLLVASVPSSSMAVGDSDVCSSWGFVFFCSLLLSLPLSPRLSFFSVASSFLLVTSFFFFLSLLSPSLFLFLSFSWSLFPSLRLSLAWLPFPSLSQSCLLSFFFCSFSSFSFFVLSSCLATPVSFSFSVLLFFFLFFGNLIASLGIFFVYPRFRSSSLSCARLILFFFFLSVGSSVPAANGVSGVATSALGGGRTVRLLGLFSL